MGDSNFKKRELILKRRELINKKMQCYFPIQNLLNI